MKHIITEDEQEQLALEVLDKLGYSIIYGPDIGPDGSKERSYKEVVLKERLRSAIDKLNPNATREAKEQAIKKVLRTDSQDLIRNNQAFHTYLTEGVVIESREKGRTKHKSIKLFDFENPKNNEFLAINQFTIIEIDNRRPDIILFVNGLPLGVIELKNIADETATLTSSYNQLQTYMNKIPSLFRFNGVLVIHDGINAQAGTITSKKEYFNPWKTINGKVSSGDQLETLIRGMFNPEAFLDLIRNFVVFEKESKGIQKKIARYHQYNATNKALASTVKAINKDKRAGVVWHTQGSGKSLTMCFYTGKLIQELDNPTVVVLTDRNDLDDQLFQTFGKCRDLLRQTPDQAQSRAKIKTLLKRASGGVIFTTIQKFAPDEGKEEYPTLSERKNIVVIVDEAHRSQYGFKGKVKQSKDQALMKYGFAKYLRDALPNASFIGFTGTPIEKADKSTPAVFGKYVDTYDIQQAVKDGATVKILYEERLVKLEIKPEERILLDQKFDEVTENEVTELKEELKNKWARLEAIVGSEKRIKRIAKDIVNHFEQRQNILEGKGMIVCMSRRICVDLYNEIIKLRPSWHNKDDDKGAIKVVMTGSASDPLNWQDHIRNKKRRRALGDRLKDPEDPMKLAIVRDMWLTGFDAPSLHTMYIDKPMQGHNLMQAIARVNRVFKDKQGGLVVDYLGIAHDLKKALAEYTKSDRDQVGIPQEDAVNLLLEKYEIVTNMFHGFNYKKFFELKPKEKMKLIPDAMNFILKQDDGNKRYLNQTTALVKAFSLAVPHPEAMKIKEEVGLFQAIKSAITKITETEKKGASKEDLDSAIKQILSSAIVSDRVIDIFAAAGIKKPDISILSDKFLAEVKAMPQKNLALEMLKKLISDQIKLRSKINLIESQTFSRMLDEAIKRYTNKSIEAAQVIEELIEIAKKMKKSQKRNKNLKLSEEEVAFYDALNDNESARLLGDKTLIKIARELADTIRKNVNVDWTLRENIQAELRVKIKRLLRKYDYPPDKQKRATEMVLKQATLFGDSWVRK